MEKEKNSHKVVTKNFILKISRDALLHIAVLLLSDAFIQTLLKYYGVTEHSIGIYTSLLNVINVSVLVFAAPLSDNAGNTIKTITKLLIPFGLTLCGFIPLCFFSQGEISSKAVFAIVLSLGVIRMLFNSVKELFEFKLPYQIIDVHDYPFLLAVSGVVTGATGTATTLVFARLTKSMEFNEVMLWASGFAVVMVTVSIILNSQMDLIETEQKSEVKKTSVAGKLNSLMKLPQFTVLIIPNFLRGIATGAFSMTAVIALNIGYSQTDVAYLVTIQSVSTIIGSLLFGVLSVKLVPKSLCFIGSVIMCLLPILAVPQRFLFFGIYLVVNLAKIFVDNSVPASVVRVINYEIAGSYHAWRLLIMNSGVALSTYLIGLLIGKVDVWQILVAASVCQLISGSVYCFSRPMREKTGHLGALDNGRNLD